MTRSLLVNLALQGYTDGLTLTLEAVQPGVNANPAPVYFNVASVTGSTAQPPVAPAIRDPQYSNIRYVWDFGDAANATPVTAAKSRLPADWKTVDKAEGPDAAHVFNDAGTYTITCTAYEPVSRLFGTATVSVTIADADVVFPDARTIIYDPNQDADTSAYPNATIVTGSVSALYAARASNSTLLERILIAPGVTITDVITSGNELTWANCRFGALDPSGASVTIGPYDPDTNGVGAWIWDARNSVELVFSDINFVGDWDSQTETGKMLRPVYPSKGSFDNGLYSYMLHKCTHTGLDRPGDMGGTPFRGGSGTQGYYTMFSQCDATNWGNFGLYGGGGPQDFIAVVGCVVWQDEDALTGGRKFNEFYNKHGCWRSTSAYRTVLDANDFFSCTGWSVGGTFNGYVRPYDQGAVRMNTSALEGAKSVISRCVFEGGVGYANETGAGPERPGNHLIDKIIVIANSASYVEGLINPHAGGFTGRNILAVRTSVPDAVDPASNGFISFLDFENSVGAANNGAAGWEVYNSTFIDMRNDAQTGNKTVSLLSPPTVSFDYEVAENNVMYQPNRSVPVDADGDLSLAAMTGIAAKHKGPRFGFMWVENTLVSDVANGASFTIPYSEVKTTPYNVSYINDGPATDQAYWTANELTDTRHKIAIAGTLYHASDNDFSVSYGASSVTITNNSGATWASGALWELKLDRSSRGPAVDPLYNANGEAIPVGRLLAGAAAIDSGDTGLYAYDDLEGAVLPPSGRDRGAIQAS